MTVNKSGFREIIKHSLKFTSTRNADFYIVKVVDMANNRNLATLRSDPDKDKPFIVWHSTFPPKGKRFYEMLYLAEINKKSLYFDENI